MHVTLTIRRFVQLIVSVKRRIVSVTCLGAETEIYSCTTDDPALSSGASGDNRDIPRMIWLAPGESVILKVPILI